MSKLFYLGLDGREIAIRLGLYGNYEDSQALKDPRSGLPYVRFTNDRTGEPWNPTTGEFAGGEEAPASASAGSVINEAKGYLGSRYIYGGMAMGGIDCSALMLKCFKTVGINLPRRAIEQSRVGTPVTRGMEQPGDLVFFDTHGKGYVSHVALYIGNGQILHASNAKRGAVINNLDEPYYRQRYISARRVLKDVVQSVSASRSQIESYIATYWGADKVEIVKQLITGENGSWDQRARGPGGWGLLQVNAHAHYPKYKGQFSSEEEFGKALQDDVEFNIKVAAQVYREQGWRAWGAVRYGKVPLLRHLAGGSWSQ